LNSTSIKSKEDAFLIVSHHILMILDDIFLASPIRRVFNVCTY